MERFVQEVKTERNETHFKEAQQWLAINEAWTCLARRLRCRRCGTVSNKKLCGHCAVLLSLNDLSRAEYETFQESERNAIYGEFDGALVCCPMCHDAAPYASMSLTSWNNSNQRVCLTCTVREVCGFTEGRYENF